MQFTLVTIGSAGDLFPFLWMGRALRERGHWVTLLGPVQHSPYVAAAGLDFHGLPADPGVLDHPDLWHPTRGLSVVWQATRPAMAQLPALVDELATDDQHVLLAHPLALPEADLCRHARPSLRIASAYLAPSNLPTVHDPLLLGPWPVPRWMPHGARRWLWRKLAARFIDPVALPDLNAQRAAHGLMPIRDLIGHLMAIPDLSLALFPGWFAAPQPDWPQPLHQVGFPLYDPAPDAAPSAELRAFLDAGPAPVVFTPGTGNRQARAYFEAAAQAVNQLGLRAVFLTPHREQIAPSLPPTICWQNYVPLNALLPHVAALVHHGGIGTTAEALRAGTPQLVVPLAHDQFDNAARVVALGAGASLHASRMTPARIVAALRRVVRVEQVARQCAQVAGRFTTPSPIDVLCRRLEELARG